MVTYHTNYAKWEGEPIQYTAKYYTKLKNYEDSEIEKKITAERVSIVDKYIGKNPLLDIGCGTGRFIAKRKGLSYGYDVMKKTISELKKKKRYIDPYKDIPDIITAYTFWDSLEHIQVHRALFNKMFTNDIIFVSMPIFDNLDNIKLSKHYRPGEHFWYFTEDGLIQYMHNYRFICLEVSDNETKAGREDIKTFVFRKR